MRFFLSILALVLLSSCYSIERDCTDFKTGTFEFTYSIDGIEQTSRFMRTEDLNIDYHEEEKADSSSIRWINDCEFILKKLHPTTNSEKEAIHMKILSTTDDSYTFEYKLAVKRPNRPSRVEKGVAKKIK
ncbi:hypothetical protein ADIWIN_4017 [Winogradskyella psychrotolerans RS-3]|uniref:DNA topoisomerase IV subunit A n=1 Tax=Winogradskyella psychrotolerans RS-3 TaxID=641526 RepID=S7VJU1_9FLAO|nr:hypothetical protein [Winogradskyella psychrotolerans]EPR69742.1 hypothetical protein ADIWIN_4017 [Winogradskyella psychrotolerans RS-3]